MRVDIICVERSLPRWLTSGIMEYQKRLTQHHVRITAIQAEKRTKSAAVNTLINKESQRLLALIKPASRVIVLDERGRSFSTESLAKRLAKYQQNAQDLSLIIGGSDGLSEQCKQQADAIWSLSALTLPHGLARLILIEQLYRAFSLLNQHPYHRY